MVKVTSSKPGKVEPKPVKKGLDEDQTETSASESAPVDEPSRNDNTEVDGDE